MIIFMLLILRNFPHSVKGKKSPKYHLTEKGYGLQERSVHAFLSFSIVIVIVIITDVIIFKITFKYGCEQFTNFSIARLYNPCKTNE